MCEHLTLCNREISRCAHRPFQRTPSITIVRSLTFILDLSIASVITSPNEKREHNPGLTTFWLKGMRARYL